MKPIRVGICGLGTVATGVIELIRTNAEVIARRLGTAIEIEMIGARRDNPNCDISEFAVSRDIHQVAQSPDVDLLVELIGGTDAASELIIKALQNGKHVVTANKALIAEQGNFLVAEAEKNGVMLNFEGAVAGGIPVLQTLKDSFAGNDIYEVTGIINGTSNYILSEMTLNQLSFKKALADAQAKGYAEADPTFDIEGLDAAHKITILASMAFGIPLDFDQVHCEGITGLELEDITYAGELGYTIKHMGIARRIRRQDTVSYEVRVHPVLIPEDELISQVHGVINAVQIKAEPVGTIMLTGAGAGGGATASAVVADIINAARYGILEKSLRSPTLAFQQHMIENRAMLSAEDSRYAWYIRLVAIDKPGVMASIATIFANEGISLEAIIQKEPEGSSQNVSIVLLTHKIEEHKITRAQTYLGDLDSVKGTIHKIRLMH